MLIKIDVLMATVCFVSGQVTYYPAVYESLGCWSDPYSVSAPASAEGNTLLGNDNYKDRELAISRCARVSAQLRHSVFAIQDGGKCSTFCKPRVPYVMFKESNACPADGKGGHHVNNVYKLIETAEVQLDDLGCWKDSLNRAIPTLEGQDPVLDGNYWERSEAIAKCVQAAYKRGFTVIALQDGGWCASSKNAGETYEKYGSHTTCENDGEGGGLGNHVYRMNFVSESYFPDN